MDDEWRLQEFSFPQTIMSRLRGFVYGVAAKWAMRHLIDQQNAINRAVHQQITQQLRPSQLDQTEWLAAQDKAHTELRHQVAELRTQLIQTQKQLAILEKRLAE